MPEIQQLLLRAACIAERQILDGGGEAQAAIQGGPADLYSGPLGLSLFWAALAEVFPKERELRSRRSLEALRVTREELALWRDRPEELDEAGTGLGGLCGLGAVIYTLTCVGQLLDRPELLAEARDAARLITPERLSRDDRLDLVNGSAGAVLALLALDEAIGGGPGGEVFSLAQLCCEHLLRRRSPASDGCLVWAREGRHFCGFAHGAAGIAHALLRVHGSSPDPMLLQAASEAIRFERGLFRPRHRTWAPFPGFPENDRPMIAWCWGAAGIALGRVASLGILNTPDIREEIRVAIAASRDLRQTLEDHLCCGNLGRAEILAYSARVLAGRDLAATTELRETALALAYDVLRRAKGRGSFGWSGNRGQDRFQPGFFKGAAGLGYAFLDLAFPGRLPFPLLLTPRPRRRG